MDILSLSPFSTAAVPWRPADGRFALTVVCKATYTLSPGVCRLAEAQEPLHERDTHWDDDPAKSVVAPSDLAPFKPRADVVLVGNAYAPEKKPVHSLVARLAVGEVDKAVAVFGTRLFTREGEVRTGAPWTKMSLRWERAAGGPDTWNPAGVRSDAPTDAFGQRSLPNLQRPNLHITQPGDILAPTGFGPLAQRWLVRRELLGSYRDGWRDGAWTRIPLGDDFDWMFFQAALTDQQTDTIPADVSIVLENLHPEHPRLVTHLPGVAPRAFVDLPGQAPRDLPLTADTLWIDTSRSICTLTWRGQLALERPDARGRVVLALEEAGQRLEWTSLAPLLAVGAGRPASIVTALLPALNGPPPTEDGDVTILKHLPRGDITRTVLYVAPEPGPSVRDSARHEITLSAVKPAPGALPFRQPALGAVSPAAVTAGSTPSPAGPRRTVEMHGVTPAALPSWLVASAPPAPPPSLASPPALVAAAVVARSLVVPAAPPALITHGTGLSAGAPDAKDLARATYTSVAEASNAAADRFAQGSAAPSSGATSGAEPPTPKPASRETTAPAAPAMDLLWFDADQGNLLRRVPRWSKLFAPQPAAKKPTSVLGLSFGVSAASDAPGMTRADVLQILTKTPLMTGEEARGALKEAYGPGGASNAPFLLLEGELELVFDEDLELRMMIEVAGPLAANDRKLKELIDAADDALRTRAFSSPDVLGGFITSIRDAWGKANKRLSSDYLAAQTERVLLSQRSYQLRSVLDSQCIRALFASAEMGGKMPFYLPPSASGRLPLFSRFQARVLAQGLPQQDQYEAHPVALRAVALARVLSSTWHPVGADKTTSVP